MTIHENGATYDFYLASTATALTIDEVLALGRTNAVRAGTPQGKCCWGFIRTRRRP